MSSSDGTTCRKRVAIVGSGAAGMAALWALNRTYHDVYLYEAADRLGGRTNTVDWKTGRHRTLVDTGFVVMNAAISPNFLGFLERVHVQTAPAEMTSGVSRDHRRLDWAGSGLRSLLSRRRNVLSPWTWRLVFDICRFSYCAIDLLNSKNADTQPRGIKRKIAAVETLGEYLELEGYSEVFRDEHLLPLIATLWNTTPDKSLLDIPAITLMRILWNSSLLPRVKSKAPQWLTIRDGSKAYIEAVMRGFPSNHRFLNTRVLTATNAEDGRVRLDLENGRSEVYDHVILATPGDEAFSIIQGSATPDERRILSSFRTKEVKVVLHSDVALLQRSRKTWIDWKRLTQSSPPRAQSASVTFDMNGLQQIPAQVFGHVLVTLNAGHGKEPDARAVQDRYTYRHWVCDRDSIRAAKDDLPLIQNTRGISYAGDWTGCGLLEDAFSSGLMVARDHLGAKIPFRLTEPTWRKTGTPQLGIVEMVVRLVILVVQVFVVELVDRAVESLRMRGRRQLGQRKQKKVS